jgi:hypothetical protein
MDDCEVELVSNPSYKEEGEESEALEVAEELYKQDVHTAFGNEGYTCKGIDDLKKNLQRPACRIYCTNYID